MDTRQPKPRRPPYQAHAIQDLTPLYHNDVEPLHHQAARMGCVTRTEIVGVSNRSSDLKGSDNSCERRDHARDEEHGRVMEDDARRDEGGANRVKTMERNGETEKRTNGNGDKRRRRITKGTNMTRGITRTIRQESNTVH